MVGRPEPARAGRQHRWRCRQRPSIPRPRSPPRPLGSDTFLLPVSSWRSLGLAYVALPEPWKDLMPSSVNSEAMGCIRRCRDDERAVIRQIINAAAEAYRGVIPVDRWHAPYMSSDELDREISAGVEFWGYFPAGARCTHDRVAEVLLEHPGSSDRNLGRTGLQPSWRARWALSWVQLSVSESPSSVMSDRVASAGWGGFTPPSSPARSHVCRVSLARRRPSAPSGFPAAPAGGRAL